MMNSMNDGLNQPIAQKHLSEFPSVADVKPNEEGGPIARVGFNYQDYIAVSFLIDMLENSTIQQIHCETHDDIVLLYVENESGNRVAEYVQVKANEGDKLWSTADLCNARSGKKSIFETSLGHDKHAESSAFRIVTLLPVVGELKILTFKKNSPGRAIDGERFTSLSDELIRRFPEINSPKGNGVAYWLQNCHWDERHDELAIKRDNLIRLIKLGMLKGLLVEHCDSLLTELLTWVQAAGAAKWDSDRAKKIILREDLVAWWERRTEEVCSGFTILTGGKLKAKMTAAGLSAYIGLAMDLRRSYSDDARTPRYMEPDEGERIQGRVKAEALSMRVGFDSGEIAQDPQSFHAYCLKRMDFLNEQRPAGLPDHSVYLKGCLYDIVDRCLFRFDKSA
jgi:hypothetical protein